MKTLLALLLLPLTAFAQSVIIPAQTSCQTLPAQTVCITTPSRTIAVTGTITPPPPPTCTPPQVLVNGVCTAPVIPPAGTAPVIGAVTALPMAWKVDCTAPAGAINLAAVDPNQTWFNSGAGSAHVSKQCPLLVQGAGGPSSASFVVYAQTASGWSAASAKSPVSSSPGMLPAWGDPYWIIHAGQYNWQGDYSFPGGDTNAIPPPKGSGGVPSAQDIEIDWWDAFPGVNGATSVKIVLTASGNFAPAITGTTIDLVAHPYKYFTLAINPATAGAKYNVIWETTNDAVVSNTVELAQYVTSPVAGVFTPNVWNHVNAPFAAFGLQGSTIYKQKIASEQGGTWHVDNLGFSNSPQ
jgi:hypothetical protein